MAGKVIGIDGFGASAPGDLVVEKYGFTKEKQESNCDFSPADYYYCSCNHSYADTYDEKIQSF